MNGEKIIQRTLHRFIDSYTDDICVVLGACATDIQPYVLNHSKVHIVYNKDYQKGQTSSMQAALASVAVETQWVMLLPVDFPNVQTATINALVEQARRTDADILIPTYEGNKGHPPLFHRRTFTNILKLSTDSGINSIFKDFKVAKIPVDDGGVLQSFNTVEEFEQIKNRDGY